MRRIMSVLLLMGHLNQNVQAEDEKNMEEVSLVLVSVSEPRWAFHM